MEPQVALGGLSFSPQPGVLTLTLSHLPSEVLEALLTEDIITAGWVTG